MNQEGRTIQAHWDLYYEHAIGPTASRFFDEIQANQKLMGKKCPKCNRVLVPPRSFCDRCFVETTNWSEVGPGGQIEAFTIVYQAFKGLPHPPYALVYVLLDGADTAIAGFLRNLDLRDTDKAVSQMQIGRRVRVVFAKERKGSVLDFWFNVV